MAISFNASLISDQTTDTGFRAWTAWGAGVFALSGAWTNTADTGQINLSTVLKPTAGDQSRGYKIYAMADALQATCPVYVKLEFGSGSQMSYPSLWLTIGTGSDGAGNLLGILLGRTQIQSNTYTSIGSPAYGSASSNRVAMGLFLGNSSVAMAFAIERTKAGPGPTLGQDTGDGLLVSWSQSNTSHKTLMIPFTGTIPLPESAYQALTSTNNPSAMSNDLGIGLVSHFYGVAQQPGLNHVVVNSNDFADYATFTMSLYGAMRTYQHLGSVLTTVNGRSGTRLCMLFE